MKIVKTLVRLLVVLFAIQFVACEKIIDFNKAVKNCRIKKIHFYIQYENADYDMDFYYNKWGNPDSVTLTLLRFENYNLYFIYNNKKQVIVLQEGRNFGQPEILHRFGYTRTLITTDTVDTWADFHYINYFEYDGHGRIIKSTVVPIDLPPGSGFEETYQYNGEGNLIRRQPSFYDNKINLQQLHPFWQFIGRDYSLNNPLPAVQYNNFGLPTRFEDHRPGFEFTNNFPFLANGSNSLDKSEIFYECK